MRGRVATTHGDGVSGPRGWLVVGAALASWGVLGGSVLGLGQLFAYIAANL
jgi:hypothetical protein